MRRLNFLEGKPWDEAEEDKRVRSVRGLIVISPGDAEHEFALVEPE
jgi:hypothetical protein